MANRPDTVFNADVIAEFRPNGGKVGRPWRDARLLLLQTTGTWTAEIAPPLADCRQQTWRPIPFFALDGVPV